MVNVFFRALKGKIGKIVQNVCNNGNATSTAWENVGKL
jgi:hypothetical protein